MSSAPTRLRLKGVITCSFVRSEATNLDLYRKSGHYPGPLKNGEAFLFISKSGNQIIFIFKSISLEVAGQHRRGDGTTNRTVIDSRKLRLDGGTWHPYMLQNYANAVGIDLIGLKRFEQIHDEMRAAKRVKKA